MFQIVSQVLDAQTVLCNDQKQTRRDKYIFNINGVSCCDNCWMGVYGICRTKLFSLFERYNRKQQGLDDLDGVASLRHGEVSTQLLQIISHIVDTHGQSVPNEPIVELSGISTQQQLFQLIQSTWPQVPISQSSLSRALPIWAKQEGRRVKMTDYKAFAKCTKCATYANQLKQAQLVGDKAAMSSITKERNEHFEEQQEQRALKQYNDTLAM